MQTLYPSRTQSSSDSRCVTSVMNDIVLVYHYQKMTEATDQLVASRTTCAVVVDGLHKCVGVLTKTDIQRYFRLWIRFLEHDKSVLPEIFETNAFGMLRIDREYFHQVGKHMTSPVVTIPSSESCSGAFRIFEQHKDIHHLIVVDEKSKPIGVVTKNNLSISRSSAGRQIRQTRNFSQST